MEALEPEALKFRSALRIVSTVALLGLLLLSVMSYLQLPKMERFFEDMLGSPKKLPALTRVMFTWGQLTAIGLGAQFMTGAGALMFAFLPRARFAGAGAVAGIVLLGLHFLVCLNAVFLPLVQLLSGLGSP